jgi:hypothetical protein
MIKDTLMGLDQTMGLAQLRKFTESSLPLTMELASVLKAIVLPHLTNNPESWHYFDRVLHWLVPSMGEDIQRYHGDDGPSISEMFAFSGVTHLDQDLVARLSSLLEKKRPGVISLLVELSSAGSEV